MKTICFGELSKAVTDRKRQLGWDTPEWTERMRNRGGERTPEKREMLKSLQERAEAAGCTPLKAYF